MLARAQYEKELKEADETSNDDEDGEGLEVYDEDGANEEQDEDGQSGSELLKKDKGKGKAMDVDPVHGVPDTAAARSTGPKRRRPPVDVFAGAFTLSS